MEAAWDEPAADGIRMWPVRATPQSPSHPLNAPSPWRACATVTERAGTTLAPSWAGVVTVLVVTVVLVVGVVVVVLVVGVVVVVLVVGVVVVVLVVGVVLVVLVVGVVLVSVVGVVVVLVVVVVVVVRVVLVVVVLVVGVVVVPVGVVVVVVVVTVGGGGTATLGACDAAVVVLLVVVVGVVVGGGGDGLPAGGPPPVPLTAPVPPIRRPPVEAGVPVPSFSGATAEPCGARGGRRGGTAHERAVPAQRGRADGPLARQRGLGVGHDAGREVAAGDRRATENLTQCAQPVQRYATGDGEQHHDDRSENQDGDNGRPKDLSPPGADKTHFYGG